MKLYRAGPNIILAARGWNLALATKAPWRIRDLSVPEVVTIFQVGPFVVWKYRNLI